MAQVTIHLPDDVARQLRTEAKKRRTSLSAYLAGLARQKLRPTRWPKAFLDVAGTWEGEFPEIPDPPPEPVDLK
jgi:hypothetical protein